ncbi:LuxR C-terminal-related transcriptional regulator [Caenispirillum bisanense]|uniref:DNA-binding response regulator, NarL/FixJ family, contains REC and HTH domains n=1 Tax=Caenispirillum bisanense TaxID=414052 RepID=A0A286H2Z6_9PROT|nr:response regulator transcription factor [Caenispirillum bisanense]SOE01654.1 DNA-binding response regulator, NarL/FixJ family, contains REC and HTH domains [Caenispirillum bisanense]
MRVILADDHSIIRAALRAVVVDIDATAEIVETGSFDALEATLADFDRRPANLVVLDLRMPGYRGQDQIQAIVERVAPCPVAIFSMSEDPEEMRALLGLGVRAFIPKSTEHPVLGGVLRIVLAGGTYVPPVLGFGGGGAPVAPPVTEVLRSVPSAAGSGASRAALPPAVAGLTRRQREVMDLLAEGLSNAEICERMGLNLSTVKAHVSGVLRALGVDSRTQAALRIREVLGRR